MATKESSSSGFSAAERDAMKQRAAELRAEKGGKKKADEAEACVARISELSQPDRRHAERIHAIVTEVAPHLFPKTWYGFPSYADADGKVVIFYKPAEKFDERYGTLGFQDLAQLDSGTMWPTSYAVTDITEADEKKLRTLVKKAAPTPKG